MVNEFYFLVLSMLVDIPPKNLSPPQIGRSADSAIDFVVVESVKNEHGKTVYKSNSTVSRYACRIQCDRRPPYTARLYAAAFDTRGRIQLSVSDRDFFRVTSSHMLFSGNHHKNHTNMAVPTWVH